ncbi:MAG: AzlC family ABC transporter permease [Spirochaetales bacterium]|nr:AzlC family ABC transporter permease [Spirochaetales bacterium]
MSSTSSSEPLFALRTSIPVFLGYLAIGIAFGLMMAGAGFAPWLAILMSLVIFAGAAQYLAVTLLSAGTGFGSIALLTFLVNARHMAYGISLIQRFAQWPKYRPYLIFALTDETYALMTSLRTPPGLDKGKVHLWMALFDQTWWVLGTTLGVLAGTWLPIPTKGLEFSLVALFGALVTDRWLESKEKDSFWVGIGSVVVAAFVFGVSNLLLPAIGLGIMALLFLPIKEDLDNTEHEHG